MVTDYIDCLSSDLSIITMSHTLPTLPYSYNALEPYISEKIMTLHHTKHHQAYVNALNAAEANYVQAATPKERIALQAAIRFNGGGKSLYSPSVAPPSSSVAITIYDLQSRS